ncbi:MAG: LPS-assembly protein LptD [Rhodospirillales bacterium]
MAAARFRRFAAALALALASAPAAGAALAQNAPNMIEFRADVLSHDRDLNITTATGNVEIRHDGRTLLADAVSYNRNDDIMTASGGVTLLEESGEVFFIDYIELTGDMRDGVAENMHMILSDGARMAARGGRRIGGDSEFRQAVYSPCELCEENPSDAPLWQLKSVRVYHDKAGKRIKYEDMWMEIAGVPVMYTPYMAHPDPTVKRQSGFLTPGFGTSSNLGKVIRTPYFWAIDRHRDATIAPFYASKEGPGADMEYRQRMSDGELNMEASVALDNESDTRGHVDLETRFDVDDNWRWGFDVHRTTDDTYMARYGISHPSTLDSQVFAEGFYGRSYVSVSGHMFQGLSAEDRPDETPVILPLIDFEYVGEPARHGGRFGVEGNLAALDRKDDLDTRRLSLRPYWHLPYTAPAGDIYDVTLTVKADAYHVDDHLLPGNEGTYSGISGRVVPEASFGWRYPFIARQESSHQVIEPIARLYLAPNGGNKDTIPNEDSQAFEFDTSNLFASSRFSGVDRVEGGARIHYGARWGVYGNEGGRTEVMFGQSYRPRRDSTTFADNTGLEDNFSDLVGRVLILPNEFFDLNYRTRLDKSSLSARRHEVNSTFGVPALRASTDYLFFDRAADSEFPSREEISAGLSSQLSRNWSANTSYVRDQAAGKTRSIGLNLTYEDECLIFRAEALRQFYYDRELEPENSLFFRITFKTLGEVNTDSGLF